MRKRDDIPDRENIAVGCLRAGQLLGSREAESIPGRVHL